MAFKPVVKEPERDSRDESLNRDDQTLVHRISAGDVAAFEQLYRNYWSQLYNFAFRYVQSSEEAEDVVQEVFFAVWRGRRDWHVNSSLRHYLFVSVRNAAIGRLRRDATMQRWRQRTVGEDSARSDDATDALVESADKNADVERALSEMPPKRRAVCALRWIDGLSYAQIAERLGINEKTVENHIGNGLRFMRSRLTPR
jgi:RNA polymerase sigma-70 factor (ECF subfamily)